jgi:hypothetical protein
MYIAAWYSSGFSAEGWKPKSAPRCQITQQNSNLLGGSLINIKPLSVDIEKIIY